MLEQEKEQSPLKAPKAQYTFQMLREEALERQLQLKDSREINRVALSLQAVIFT